MGSDVSPPPISLRLAGRPAHRLSCEHLIADVEPNFRRIQFARDEAIFRFLNTRHPIVNPALVLGDGIHSMPVDKMRQHRAIDRQIVGVGDVEDRARGYPRRSFAARRYLRLCRPSKGNWRSARGASGVKSPSAHWPWACACARCRDDRNRRRRVPLRNLRSTVRTRFSPGAISSSRHCRSTIKRKDRSTPIGSVR